MLWYMQLGLMKSDDIWTLAFLSTQVCLHDTTRIIIIAILITIIIVIIAITMLLVVTVITNIIVMIMVIITIIPYS